MKSKQKPKASPISPRSQKASEQGAKPKRRINTYWRRDGTKVHGHMRKSFGLSKFLFGVDNTTKESKSRVWIGIAVLVTLFSVAGAVVTESLIPLGICAGSLAIGALVYRKLSRHRK